ncbi:F-box only protein 9 isoform X2 [Hermetia illucens]|nr:F-box only protein 9 isoform X2 [Hermetia illucens]
MTSNAGGIDGDGEDSEESSSSLATMPGQFMTVLDDFREQWQKELKGESSRGTPTRENNKHKSLHTTQKGRDLSDESRAEQLFLQGAELEKRGKVYDALTYYRRAVQIVPDIEFRIYEAAKKAQQASAIADTANLNRNTADDEEDTINDADGDEDEDLSNVDLFARFHNAILKSDSLFTRTNAEKGMLITGMHISDLPMEIILYILRWVVSAQLDFRSLEQCAAVCKGFYLCARDEEIWRLACLKVWGVNTGILQNSGYNMWREMYIHRHRVLFHGCYISKASYMRYGENSFQDQFYRPVQIVEYYRYVRFFPDGVVLMMTSADDPAQVVGKLRTTTNLRPEILKGHYRLHGEQVIIVLKRYQKTQTYSAAGGKKRGSSNEADDSHTFFIELNVASSTRRKFNQLIWKSYTFTQMKNSFEIRTDFELTSAKYPPFWFSRVKSYHLEADAPLQ